MDQQVVLVLDVWVVAEYVEGCGSAVMISGAAVTSEEGGAVS